MPITAVRSKLLAPQPAIKDVLGPKLAPYYARGVIMKKHLFKSIGLTFLCVSLSSLTSFADSIQGTTSLKTRKSSLELRQDKKFEINIGGALEHQTTASTVHLSYSMRPDLRTYIKYSNLIDRDTKLPDSNFSTYSASQKEAMKDADAGRSFEIGLQSFLSNSFFVRAGLYDRTQYAYDRGTEIGGNIKDIGFSLSVGNQWNFDHLVLGADWFGVDVAHYKKAENLSKEMIDKNTNHFSFLHVFIGYPF